ncbi:MAG: aldehyde ferredoxin oxidoreductase, partial [Desulfobacterales bacterium]|nr:aldehyde ferredoxin oxidoreductase [Desulfobacterales bacterium]
VVGQYLAGSLDPLKAEGQVEASREAQIMMAAVDCTGLCLLASFALADPGAAGFFLQAVNARFGWRLGPEDIPAMGVRVLKAERQFNRAAGFTSKDDRLPKFFREEPLPPHNKVFLISDEEIDGVFDF